MNSLGSTKEIAENKLILLYVIDKINMPLSNLQLTRLILEKRFMNYFLMQQYLDELCESRLILSESIEGKSVYRITEKGKKTLDYFPGLIPPGIKARIDNTVSATRNTLRNETLITADYTPESENEFIVTCKVHEDDFPLIDLSVTVGTKNDARAICESWKNHSQEIYSEIIEILTRKRDKKREDDD